VFLQSLLNVGAAANSSGAAQIMTGAAKGVFRRSISTPPRPSGFAFSFSNHRNYVSQKCNNRQSKENKPNTSPGSKQQNSRSDRKNEGKEHHRRIRFGGSFHREEGFLPRISALFGV
jgi:hypothetical protein